MNEQQERTMIRRRLLGRGLLCRETLPGVDLGRDIEFTAGPQGRDLALIEGMDNLSQDLSIALTTLAGSDIFNSAFGFAGLNAIAEEPNPILARERIRIAVINVLRTDSRIRRIIDVKLAGDQLDQVESGSRELNIVVRFETISGDEVTIDLAREILNV